MAPEKINGLFTKDILQNLFPKERADQFFEALFGDANEGSFDIGLAYTGHSPEQKTLHFELLLTERPGKCLACNLTYGMPEVFSRHPIIDIKGLVRNVEELLGSGTRCDDWRLGSTRSMSGNLHVIPLTISMDG